MMTPKKILIIGGCVLVIGAIGGMLNPKLAPQPKTQKQEAIQVGVKAGIGDTESRWEKDYGNLAGQDMIKNVTINGSHVTAVFADDKALTITIEKRDKYYKNSAIDDMLPSDRKEIEKYSHLATLKEVADNDYNLNIPRYVDTFEEEEPIDIKAVMAEIKELEAKRAELDKEIEVYLKELGLVD